MSIKTSTALFHALYKAVFSLILITKISAYLSDEGIAIGTSAKG
jgi:hypothetical protein